MATSIENVGGKEAPVLEGVIYAEEEACVIDNDEDGKVWSAPGTESDQQWLNELQECLENV